MENIEEYLQRKHSKIRKKCNIIIQLQKETGHAFMSFNEDVIDKALDVYITYLEFQKNINEGR